MGSIPGWGTKIPHAGCPINKIKQFKKKKRSYYKAQGTIIKYPVVNHNGKERYIHICYR